MSQPVPQEPANPDCQQPNAFLASGKHRKSGTKDQGSHFTSTLVYSALQMLVFRSAWMDAVAPATTFSLNDFSARSSTKKFTCMTRQPKGGHRQLANCYSISITETPPGV